MLVEPVQSFSADRTDDLCTPCDDAVTAFRKRWYNKYSDDRHETQCQSGLQYLPHKSDHSVLDCA